MSGGGPAEEHQREERRLTTILSADVVGYSRLMGADEAGTLAALKKHRNELLEPKTSQYRGRVVKLMGDGTLMEFGSVVDAVRFAVEVQHAMRERNAEVPEAGRIKFRIGINIGDIIVEGADIHGDGVNVAARLESLAEPAGICVARNVLNQVKNKLDLNFKHLGEQHVKNIAEPVSAYRVLIDDTAANLTTPVQPVVARRRWHWATAVSVAAEIGVGPVALWFQPWRSGVPPTLTEGVTYPSPDKPSIAVLPFENLSDNPEQEYFSDGITVDIITDLSKFSSLLVIAANSTFRYKDLSVKPQEVSRELGARYVLEGTVQRIEEQLRINAQLIDAATGHHVWADRYDRKTEDLFAVQNEIARKIVEIIGPISDAHGKLLKVELDRLARTPTRSLEAYDHFLRGVVHYDKFTDEHNKLAMDEFEDALELDPYYAKAMAKKAWTYIQDSWSGWAEDSARSLSLAQQTAQYAIDADPSEPDAHRALGAVMLFLGNHDLAIDSYRKAVELNPNGADLIMELGWALTYSGQPDEGLRIMDEAVSRNPYYPGWYLWDFAWGHFVAHRYESAIEALESPKSNFTHLMLAVNYAKVGRYEESSASMEVFRELEPRYSIETAATTEPFKHAEDLEHYLQALRQVGLPETSPNNI